MVSVSASSKNISLWASALIGAIGSFIYTLTKSILIRYEIDDPLDISEVHGACGIWSIIAIGVFDRDYGLIYTGDIG